MRCLDAKTGGAWMKRPAADLSATTDDPRTRQKGSAMTTALPYRVAACDLDRTILIGSNLSRENRQAVRSLIEHGMTVVLATGRNFHHAVRSYQDLALTGPLVTSDGALVTIPGAGGGIIGEHCLPLAVSGAIIKTAYDRRITCLNFFRHGIYASSKFDWHADMERHREIGRHFRLSNPASMIGRSIYKAFLFSHNATALDALQRDILHQHGTEAAAIRNSSFTLELISKGVSKVSGLQLAVRHLGFSSSQVVAFGDGLNDVGMFGWSGLSFCMHHGATAAREAAAMVAPPTEPAINFAAAVAAALSATTTE